MSVPWRQLRDSRLLTGLRRALTPKISRNAKAVFFLSTGRSGTAFLAKLFESDPGVHAVHEPKPRLFQERLDVFHTGDLLANRWRSTLRSGRARRINAIAAAGRTYVETSAFLSFFTPVLHQMMPAAKFVYIHRHPGEVVRSGMRRRWYDGHPNDHTRLCPPASLAGVDWGSMTPFEKICWYWNAYNEQCLNCLQLIEAGRKLIIPFEEMMTVEGATKLLSFSELSVPCEDKIQAMLAQPENAQLSGDFPHYSEWSEGDKATLRKLAKPCMDQLGYTI